jgi:hypothetical protein
MSFHVCILLRLYETLQLGSIPIYLWLHQRWVPFEDLVDWSEFALILPPPLVFNGELPRKVATMQDSVGRMLERAQQVRHMFTYNFTVHYILSQLQ